MRKYRDNVQLEKIGDVSFNQSDVELIETERCYSGFFQLDRMQLRHRLFNGDWSNIIHRELVHRKEAVAALIYDPDLDAVCLIQQFRSALIGKTESPWSHELVAGLVDKEGESLEQVVRREMQEESGLLPRHLEKINSYWLSIGGSNERMHLYLALTELKDVEPYHGVQGESEDIRTLVVAREEAKHWAFNSMESNASSIIALQWLENERERLAKLWQGYRL